MELVAVQLITDKKCTATAIFTSVIRTGTSFQNTGPSLILTDRTDHFRELCCHHSSNDGYIAITLSVCPTIFFVSLFFNTTNQNDFKLISSLTLRSWIWLVNFQWWLFSNMYWNVMWDFVYSTWQDKTSLMPSVSLFAKLLQI